MAGIGNWNTAKYWKYSTRNGHRENPDPVRIPGESPYNISIELETAYKFGDLRKGQPGREQYGGDFFLTKGIDSNRPEIEPESTSPPLSAPSSSSDGNTSNVKYNVGGGSAGNRGVQTVNQ